MTIYTSQEPKYCTYLTIYFGNSLPPFYIGSTSIDKILNKNYHGTVCSKKYKDIWEQEIRQNPHLFKTKILRKFYSRKNTLYHERRLQKAMNVIKSPMYINMAIAAPNGFFGMDHKNRIMSIEHKRKISESNIGKTFSEETKLKMSISQTGRIGIPHTEESKRKISESNMGKTFSEKHKENLSKSLKLVMGGANNSNAKSYEFISPTNDIFLVAGELVKFCKNNNLSTPSIIDVLKGRRDNYKGWTAKYISTQN